MRKLEKPPIAVCALEIRVFAELRKKCKSKPFGHIGHRTGAAYFIFQIHMIARLDCVINFKLEDLTPNIEHQIEDEMD